MEPIDFGLSVLASWIANLFGKGQESQKLQKRNKAEIQVKTPQPTGIERIAEPESIIEERAHEKNSVTDLAERFLEIFKNHGVHPNTNPRCLPSEYGISLREISDINKLIERLTPEVIDWTCSVFNIRRNWLEANGHYIYKTENYYKCEHDFLRLLKDLRIEHNRSLRVIAYKSVDELNSEGGRPQDINILITVPALKIADKTIFKYIPTSTHWDWGYWRSRYQFKAITRVCYKQMGLMFDGYDLDKEKMMSLSSGNVFPKKICVE